MVHQQQQKRSLTCFGCGQEIKLKRKPDDIGWIRLNSDNITAHQCDSSFKNKEQQQQLQPSNNNDNLKKLHLSPACAANAAFRSPNTKSPLAFQFP